jgi:citrate lyase beta subunit
MPSQLATVETALKPTEAEIDRACRIVAADIASEDSAVGLDGSMIDRPAIAYCQPQS